MQSGSAADGTRRPRPVHRLLWQERYGPIPAGDDVHHKCEKILCVNVECFELLEHGNHAAYHAGQLSTEAKRARSQYAMHVRWHVNRESVVAGCTFCDDAAMSRTP